jgi:hypothetical protein
MGNYKKASQKTDLILDILMYATKNNLNITERGDVIKILDALHISYIDDDLNEWMTNLKDADTYMDKADKDRERIKTKQVN